jgi:hypothetical protein
MTIRWQDDLREDIEAFAIEHGVPESDVWEMLSTPFDAGMTDEQIALFTRYTKWSVRRYGLENKVSVTTVRGTESEGA